MPMNIDSPLERRMLYVVFSDFYHYKGENDDYREMRDPKIDLGVMIPSGFDETQWNKFYHFMLHCLKFFIGVDEKLKPGMENVNKRNLLNEMANLHDWALIYFSETSGTLDEFIVREEAFKDYVKYNGRTITPQVFIKRLKAFCRYYGYLLNPKDFRDKYGKIIQKIEPKMYHEMSNTWETIAGKPKVSKEMIYIQTKATVEAKTPQDSGEQNKLPF
jgi:hypothetical protein